jgi:LemA protein
MSLLLWVPLGILGVLVLFVIVQYNKLVGMRLRIGESWSNVDTELKRRHDQIPNLVATVKGYAAHERQLFESITALRSRAGSAGDTSARRGAERDLSIQLGRLLAVAESYPQLRANENFLQLQRELTTTEDRIQASRRFYNGNVRDYNNQVQQFPSNLVANTFRFRAHEYFELPNAAERAAPAVELSRH